MEPPPGYQKDNTLWRLLEGLYGLKLIGPESLVPDTASLLEPVESLEEPPDSVVFSVSGRWFHIYLFVDFSTISPCS